MPRKLLKWGNFSREETVCRNKVVCSSIAVQTQFTIAKRQKIKLGSIQAPTTCAELIKKKEKEA